MKPLLFLLIFTSALFANDPTVIKGKLKEVLDKPKAIIPKNKKADEPKVIKETIKKNLQTEIDQLVFKAFYKKDQINRLMLEFEKKTLLLEANDKIDLKGEKFLVLNFDNINARLMHISSKEILTFTYRP